MHTLFWPRSSQLRSTTMFAILEAFWLTIIACVPYVPSPSPGDDRPDDRVMADGDVLTTLHLNGVVLSASVVRGIVVPARHVVDVDQKFRSAKNPFGEECSAHPVPETMPIGRAHSLTVTRYREKASVAQTSWL